MIQKSLKICLGVGAMLSVVTLGCQSRKFNVLKPRTNEGAAIKEVQFNREQLLAAKKFDLITPTGEQVMAAGLEWLSGQENEASSFAQPAQCANNVSRVYEMAGIGHYSSPLLDDMVNAVKARGGLVIRLPKNKEQIAQKIATVFGGKIPVGSFVSGCLRSDCTGEAGDGHISIVGDIDSNENIKIYHNNWYRPDNEGGQWKPNMIPLDWFKSGLKRKWMPTPWLKIIRNAESNAPESIHVPLPAIDDLDPTNYFLTISVPIEILNEVKNGKGVSTDGRGKISTVSPTGMILKTETISTAKQECTKYKVTDTTGANFRAEPNGAIKCALDFNTIVTRTDTGAGNKWMSVQANCGNGPEAGFIHNSLLAPACVPDSK